MPNSRSSLLTKSTTPNHLDLLYELMTITVKNGEFVCVSKMPGVRKMYDSPHHSVWRENKYDKRAKENLHL
jgi:hypothetical protein